jgi:glycosyltransferase 2 family protein
MNNKNTKSLVQFVVLLSIGILLIWLSLRQVAPEKDRIIAAFKNADYFWVFVSMGIAFLSHFFRAYRWNHLLKPVGHKINLMNSTCYVLVGYLANYGIPRMGEISRCTLATKYDKVPFEVGFGTVITERIIDFLIFLVIFFLTLAFQFTELIGLANKLIFDPFKLKLASQNLTSVKFVVVASLGIAFLLFLFLFRKKIGVLLKGKFGGIIKRLLEGIGSIARMEKPFQFILLSLTIWACYFYSLYTCFFAINETSMLGHKECLVLLLFGTFGVIFSPGGLGAYPAIVGGILLFTYNIDTAFAFALPWLSWTSQFILILVTGLISLIILPFYNRRKNVISQPAEI